MKQITPPISHSHILRWGDKNHFSDRHNNYCAKTLDPAKAKLWKMFYFFEQQAHLRSDTYRHHPDLIETQTAHIHFHSCQLEKG